MTLATFWQRTAAVFAAAATLVLAGCNTPPAFSVSEPTGGRVGECERGCRADGEGGGAHDGDPETAGVQGRPEASGCCHFNRASLIERTGVLSTAAAPRPSEA